MQSLRQRPGVTVHEERDDADGAHVHRGYRARNVVTVRLSAPSRAGRLIQGAVGRVNANVHGPLWWIAPDDPARVEACAGAAVEARRKAEAYAQALGLSLGRIIEVRESGSGWLGEPRPVARAVATYEPRIDVEPGSIDVSASVEVTFEVSSG